MAKTTITGRRVSRTSRQVAEDIIRQLVDHTVTDWLSNGEDAVHGKLWCVQACGKGLDISLTNGRHVTWKVGKAAVAVVMAAIQGKVTTAVVGVRPMLPV